MRIPNIIISTISFPSSFAYFTKRFFYIILFEILKKYGACMKYKHCNDIVNTALIASNFKDVVKKLLKLTFQSLQTFTLLKNAKTRMLLERSNLKLESECENLKF